MTEKLKRLTVPLLIVFVMVIGALVVHARKKTITVTIDEQTTQLVTYEKTLSKALAKNNITVGPKDKIEPNLDSKIVNNDIIKIKRAVNISVAVDGKELSILSAEDNLDSALKAEGITLNTEDKINPEKEVKLTEGMKAMVTRVDSKTFTESKSIDFKTIIKNDDDLPNLQKKVLQEGKPGEKEITTSVIYENGKEVSRRVVSESILSVPVDKIVAQGTLQTLQISRGGNSVGFTRKFSVRSTAYSADEKGISNYTSSGRHTVRDPNGYSTIAIDPSVIPYGTKLYVENYGFAIAADTGSAIKGKRIDVFFNTQTEARRWGVKYVNVYILK